MAKTPGVNILVTAGPTREALDPARFLSNRSSGKMGYELAAAFARAGHCVLLVSGPTALDVPDQVDFLPVESAADMFAAVARHLGRMELAVFAAAVADYAPVTCAPEKIQKSAAPLILELVPTADILGSARRPLGFTGTLVGFAAETGQLEARARNKLVRKCCDLVVANDVSIPGCGFDADTNEVLLVYPNHSVPLPRATKHALAHQLVAAILELHSAKAGSKIEDRR